MILGAMALALTAPDNASPADLDALAVPYPRLSDTAADAAGFVPAGWKLDRSAAGDLNGDGLADLALVLQKTDPANLIKIWEGGDERFNSNPRVLLIAFRVKFGGYRRVATDYRLITRLVMGNMEDPFDGLSIAKGVLRVDLHLFMTAGGWWTGNYAFKFRWQGSDFRLIGYDRQGIKRNTLEADGISINYLSGVRIVSGSGPEESRPWSKRERLPRRSLLKLGEVGSGLEFQPDAQ